jgi:hypothetical protein
MDDEEHFLRRACSVVASLMFYYNNYSALKNGLGAAVVNGIGCGVKEGAWPWHFDECAIR